MNDHQTSTTPAAEPGPGSVAVIGTAAIVRRARRQIAEVS